jgi:hypothetical protein
MKDKKEKVPFKERKLVVWTKEHAPDLLGNVLDIAGTVLKVDGLKDLGQKILGSPNLTEAQKAEANEMYKQDLEAEIEFLKISAEDRSNARNREINIATNENVSWITRNAATLISLTFVGTTLLLYTLSVAKAVEIHENILRDLRDIVILIMGYYFGSSIGSKEKNEIFKNKN